MNRIIIDVREPDEYAHGHVRGAINIPPDKLIRGNVELADVPKDSELILYCTSGSRSKVAANILRTFGFTNITNGISQRHVEAKYPDLV